MSTHISWNDDSAFPSMGILRWDILQRCQSPVYINRLSFWNSLEGFLRPTWMLLFPHRYKIFFSIPMLVVCLSLAQSWGQPFAPVTLTLQSLFCGEVISQLIQRYLTDVCCLQLPSLSCRLLFFFFVSNIDKQEEASLTKQDHIS